MALDNIKDGNRMTWYRAVIREDAVASSKWFDGIRDKIKANKRVAKIWPLLVDVVDRGCRPRYRAFKTMWLAGNALLNLDTEKEMVVAILWRVFRDIDVDVLGSLNISLPDFTRLLKPTEMKAIKTLAEPTDSFEEKLPKIKKNKTASAVYASDAKTYVEKDLLEFAEGRATKRQLRRCVRKNNAIKALGGKAFEYPDGFLVAAGLDKG